MKNIPDIENKTAQEVLEWADQRFKDRVALASSFGAEDVVLIDMWTKLNPALARKGWVNPKPRLFTLDTGRLPQETYNVIEEIRKKYKVDIEFYFPDTKTVEEMLNKYGPNLFYESIELRRLCCQVRKTEPLNRALKDLDAWVCGLRREQSVTRQEVRKIEEDSSHNGIFKINPLADWTEKEVWDYIRVNKVPYNKLHDQGYPSIGCAPCTRAIKPGEDIRAGRWWWETPQQKECGLHCKK